MVDKKFQAEGIIFPFLQIAENILFHTRRFCAKLVGGFIDFAAVVWRLAAASVVI